MPPGLQPVVGTAGAPAGTASAEPPASRDKNDNLVSTAPCFPATASPARMRATWVRAEEGGECLRVMMPPSPGRTPWARGPGTGAWSPWRPVVLLICLQKPCRCHMYIAVPACTAPCRPISSAMAKVPLRRPPRSSLWTNNTVRMTMWMRKETWLEIRLIYYIFSLVSYCGFITSV